MPLLRTQFTSIKQSIKIKHDLNLLTSSQAFIQFIKLYELMKKTHEAMIEFAENEYGSTKQTIKKAYTLQLQLI